MNEAFIQFLWNHKLFKKETFTTFKGERIEIIDPGKWNHDSGPDFFNARIKIGQVEWAGNVEIHLRSSDWKKHKHHLDPSYDNVILHVVLENDVETFNSRGTLIPTVAIRFDTRILQNYEELVQSKNQIPCSTDLFLIEPFHIKYWLGNVLVERLRDKTLLFEHLLKKSKNNWEESFYQGLARSFGFKTNSEQFEQLARSLPNKILLHHKNDLFQIEALLFGQAGLLSRRFFSDNYFTSLQKEYSFLQKKFHLKPMAGHLWKFMRMRPLNFPSIRIAQFASFIYKNEGLFSRIIETRKAEDLKNLFDFQPTVYWETHYRFNKSAEKRSKKMGADARNSVIINTIIPFLFLYGKEKGLPDYKERALELLENLPAEKNRIIRKWAKSGIQADNAFYSQSLIQLTNNYCQKKRCLECEIGNKIISFKNT